MIADDIQIIVDCQVLPGVGVDQLYFFKDHRQEEFCITAIMLRAVNGLNGTIQDPPSYYTLKDMEELFCEYKNDAVFTITINSKIGAIVPVYTILWAEKALPKCCVPFRPYKLKPLWLIVKKEDEFKVRIDWPEPIPHTKWRQGSSWGEHWQLYLELNLCVIDIKKREKRG